MAPTKSVNSAGDSESDDLPTAKKMKPDETNSKPLPVKTIRIGSRDSKLALIQTDHVISELRRIHGDETYVFEVLKMKTTGDNQLDTPLSQIGAKALFTKELEEALLTHDIDFIVHSLKDLPTRLPDGCSIGAVLKREDPSDAIVLKSGLTLANPMDIVTGKYTKASGSSSGPVIGTSSHRRMSQIKGRNPNAIVKDVRGNLTTRFSKLDGSWTFKEGQEKIYYDCIILATAGLIRSGLDDRLSMKLNTGCDWYHAVGQGALAIEVRSNDESIQELIQPLIHYDTVCEILAERRLMCELEGGCSVPIGVRCDWEQSELKMSGAVFSLDGSQKVVADSKVIFKELPTTETMEEHLTGGDMKSVTDSKLNLTGLTPPKCPVLLARYKQCVELGAYLAAQLSTKGATDILNAIKSSRDNNQSAK